MTGCCRVSAITIACSFINLFHWYTVMPFGPQTCLLICVGGAKPTDPCTICRAGTYSSNKGTERCRYGPEEILTAHCSYSHVPRTRLTPAPQTAGATFPPVLASKLHQELVTAATSVSHRWPPSHAKSAIVQSFDREAFIAACRPCPLGFVSPEGAHSEEQCYAINICPAGTGALAALS